MTRRSLFAGTSRESTRRFESRGLYAKIALHCSPDFCVPEVKNRQSFQTGIDELNSQNVNNFGDNNSSYQFNGETKLASLDIDGLAREDRLALTVVRSERRRRQKIGAALAALALVCIVGTYVFFVNRGELTMGDVFNNFGAAIAGPLLGIVVSGFGSLAFGVCAFGLFRHPSEVEKSNRGRRKDIQHLALSKGYSIREWRAAKKSIRESGVK